MSESFKDMKAVAFEALQERLETINELKENKMESYEIVKDRETGELYLHYSYYNPFIEEDGVKEFFHQMLPLDNEDVLAILYQNKLYSYPTHWKGSYLRSGEGGQLVWFSPADVDEIKEEEQLGLELQKKLAAFQADGSFDDEAMQKLFAEIDQMMKKESD